MDPDCTAKFTGIQQTGMNSIEKRLIVKEEPFCFLFRNRQGDLLQEFTGTDYTVLQQRYPQFERSKYRRFASTGVVLCCIFRKSYDRLLGRGRKKKPF